MWGILATIPVQQFQNSPFKPASDRVQSYSLKIPKFTHHKWTTYPCAAQKYNAKSQNYGESTSKICFLSPNRYIAPSSNMPQSSFNDLFKGYENPESSYNLCMIINDSNLHNHTQPGTIYISLSLMDDCLLFIRIDDEIQYPYLSLHTLMYSNAVHASSYFSNDTPFKALI